MGRVVLRVVPKAPHSRSTEAHGVITHIGVGDLPLSHHPIAKVENDPVTSRCCGLDPASHTESVKWGAMSGPPESAVRSQPDVDVLVVDDDDAIRSTWAEILRTSGYSVALAEDGDVALHLLKRQSVGMVLLDLRMPRRDGLSVLEALTAPQLVVIASGHSLDEATRARTDAKVVTYLEKPVPPERLLDVVASTLARS